MSQNEFPPTYIKGFHDDDSVKRMEYRELGNTGLMVSKLSYGVSALGSVFRKTNDDESMEVVKAAIASGINWIDAAPWYGHGKGETVLGKALKKHRIPRGSFYVSTKVGRYAPDVEEMFDFSAERVIRSVDESLERLGLDYVDLIQIHDMEFAPSLDVIINETLPALQKVKAAGKARFIGITGYPLDNFRFVIEHSAVPIDTILTYCHYCLNDTSLESHLEFFRNKGVGVINGSPNGMGLLTSRGPPEWHVAPDDIKDACQQAVHYCNDRDVDISKLAVHFTCSNSAIPTTLVSTASLVNLQKNLDSACNALTLKEQAVMEDIRDKFFKRLNNKGWEEIEVEKYRRKLSAVTKADM